MMGIEGIKKDEAKTFPYYILHQQGDRPLGRIVPGCYGIKGIRNKQYIMFPCRGSIPRRCIHSLKTRTGMAG